MWSILLAWAATATALRTRQEQPDAGAAGSGTASISADAFLLIGGGPSGTISAATFDGASFTFVANNTIAGTSPSWLLYKDPGLVYAVDENSNSTRLFALDSASSDLSLVQEAEGSSGVVSLAFNLERTRMVGAAFGQGQVDVWDVSADNGSMALLKQIVSSDALGPNTARQGRPHPHQVLLDNSGRFFVVPDLGTDTLLVILKSGSGLETALPNHSLVIDAQDDSFTVVNHVRVPDAGCGPRHGAFFPATGSALPTAYLLVCEMLSVVEVFSLNFTGSSSSSSNLTFAHVQTISTFGPDAPPANASSATAAEIVLAADSQNVYVSNRNTGNATDSVSHFTVVGGQGSGSDTLALTFVESISSGGLGPRMFSLSNDGNQAQVFLANQDGDKGLLAIPRSSADGTLSVETAPPSVQLSVFGQPGQGPQFVQQVPIAVPANGG